MHVSAPAPDPAIGQASQQQIQLAQQEYNDQHDLVQQYSPMFQQQMQLSLQQQQDAESHSQSIWNQYQTNFQPLETQLATTAASYNSADRREQAASDASAAVGSQFSNAREQQMESLQAAGVQPGSGKALALSNDLGIREATAKAGAADAARVNVENTGLSLLGNAVNVGRGMPATGIQEGAFGAQEGGAVQGSIGGLSGLTAAPLATSSGARMAGVSGLIGLNNLQLQGAQQSQGFFGDMLGAGMQAYGMYSSSKGLKTRIGAADKAEPSIAPDSKAAKGLSVTGGGALKKLANAKDMPVDAWRYKPGAGDGGAHVGPYAEDVHRAFGDSVAPGGKAINMGAMSDKNSQAIAELTAKLAGLKKQLAQLEST